MLFIIITIFTCALPLTRENIKYVGKIVSNSEKSTDISFLI